MRLLAVACLLVGCGVGVAQSAAVPAVGTGELAKARVFSPEQGSVRMMANGGQSRDILRAALATLGKELASSLAPIVSDKATSTSDLDSSTAGLVAHLRALRASAPQT